MIDTLKHTICENAAHRYRLDAAANTFPPDQAVVKGCCHRVDKRWKVISLMALEGENACNTAHAL